MRYALLVVMWMTVPALAQHPVEKDRTGIHWVQPFKKAWEKARTEQRPLLLLPLAGTGGQNPGNW